MPNAPNNPDARFRARRLSRQLQPGVQPVYDVDLIEAIYSFNTFRTDYALWSEAVWRMAVIIGFFCRIVWLGWWDRQIWTYIGESDIDRAQSERRHHHGRWVTERLLHFGPTFIKVGQSLSTRVDLIRKEYIDELSLLQDRVPPFSTLEVRRIIHEELGESPEALFEDFTDTPLAAASLGQVHRVTLKSGEDAVIKVQRPDLVRQFYIDIAVLKKIARILQRVTELGRGREWPEIVDEFGRTLFEEIDYIREGRNADRFRRNFSSQPAIRVPQIYWQFTARRVIAMEYLPGVKVNDLATLDTMHLNRADISVTLVKAYFQQLLLDGFFHADPHPGNVVVDPSGRIILYDYGMVGSIADDTRIRMVNTFLNIVNKRTDAILKNLVDLNMVTPSADMEEIRAVVDWALENYYDVPHDQLNFEQLAEEMAEVMYYYPFKLPASFTFMFRALITLEGVATTLYPNIQFMGIAVDYAKEFVGRTLLFERFFKSPRPLENLGNLVREGLEYLGIPMRGATSHGVQRVRLYYDELKPLARYVKAGFILLAFGQVTTLVIVIAILLIFMHPITSPGKMSAIIYLLTGLMVLVLMTFGTLLWLPSRKKPFSFNPPKTKKLSE